MQTPIRASPKVKFVPSPCAVEKCAVTPYAQVYGVHPAFFDFDRNGEMQPTQAGMIQRQRGLLQAFTPTVRGRMALVVQGGSPGCSSPETSPQGRPRTGRFGPVVTAVFFAGEHVMVVTDDGKSWMDAVVVAVYPTDCMAEGYSVPGGTVKVQYELGIKWVMPSTVSTTLRKKLHSLIQQPAQQHQPAQLLQHP